MMSNLEKQEKFFPYLADKAILDFVNGLDVVKDHVAEMQSRSSLGNRLLDSLSGKTHMRQVAINQNIQSGLQGCLSWLNELNEKVVEHAYAIQNIKNVLEKHADILDALVDNVLEIKTSLQSLNDRIEILEHKLNGINLKVNAKDQLNRLMTAWKANDDNFHGLSIIEKVYYVLENLSYGAFNAYLMNLEAAGDFQTITEEKNHLKNSLIDCIKLELNMPNFNADLPMARRIWLDQTNLSPEKQEVFEYLGDRSRLDISLFPMTFLASQWNVANDAEKNHVALNYIISPSHLIMNLQKEVGIVGGVHG
ncbi:Hypothetical protein F387_00287 [Wohlfahrtiimonas chitiniclastica SH04]|uniref:Uncharacterized protein n=1 Tax=Wohlfahrtiimonas chitiniclastica SH04 TaxID=1261130 RepID=L8Y1H3_9GAMM|nr:diguanylate cyclase regulator RdcB family protein [Wohlfahrtiimonas chitiniclastica]ELV08894.1 Hypothetical protein F387_00287 [Wohlfahrtiimonas chitiniclastica SH04]